MNARNITLIIFWTAVVLLGNSCSCNYHLKKASQKCGKTVIQDTILVHDSITITETRTDTIFEQKQGDTVYIDKDRLHIKYVKMKGDTVFIDGKCDPITIIREIKVPCETTKLNFDWRHWISTNIIWLLLIFTVIAVVLWLIKK